MHALYYLSVWLHILAAALWVGGMAFLVLVIVPLLRHPGTRETAAALVHRSGLRFRAVGWGCLATLGVTGAVNMWFRGVRWHSFLDGSFAANPVARPLALKLVLVAAVLAVSAVHDFSVGPRATALWQERPGTPEATVARQRAGLLGRVNALLALAVVFLAVALVRGGFP